MAPARQDAAQLPAEAISQRRSAAFVRKQRRYQREDGYDLPGHPVLISASPSIQFG